MRSHFVVVDPTILDLLAGIGKVEEPVLVQPLRPEPGQHHAVVEGSEIALAGDELVVVIAAYAPRNAGLEPA